jgi:hypothetical protein
MGDLGGSGLGKMLYMLRLKFLIDSFDDVRTGFGAAGRSPELRMLPKRKGFKPPLRKSFRAPNTLSSTLSSIIRSSLLLDLRASLGMPIDCGGIAEAGVGGS